MLIQKSTELNIDLNAKHMLFDRTAFHLACENGHSKIAKMLIQKSAEFNIGHFQDNNTAHVKLQLITN